MTGADALRGAAVLAHGGGLTHVLNASLAGVYEECRRHPEITALYGARNGMRGVLDANFIDLGSLDPARISAVARSPGSALGSSRRTLCAGDYDRILTVFQARNVRYFFYNGGNGSMIAAQGIAQAAAGKGYKLRVIGIPKTIDNDIAGTDHCPGYGSAARFFACALRDIGADCRGLPPPISVVEVMGRNTGWLAAATALARHVSDDPPHLIYLPERPLPVEQLLDDVDAVYRRLGWVVFAICEGQTDDKGDPFGADVLPPDGTGHLIVGNLGHAVAQLITTRLKIRARSEKPGLLGRSSAAFISAVDQREARMSGRAAVRAAVQGASAQMVTLVRQPGARYRCTTGLTSLEEAAGRQRLFPMEWIHTAGNDVLAQFVEYVSPLTGRIDPLPRLT